jgi:hypothetical protein
MNWFPQLASGSIAQFPLERVRHWRWITNATEGGNRIAVPDNSGNELEWRLHYLDLTDTEAATIVTLFRTARGTYGSFGFVDPTANLIAWSQDLSKSDWQAGSLSIVGGVTDPAGGSAGWQLTNATAGDLTLSQSIELPGDYMACFSLWMRSQTPATVRLVRDASAQATAIGPVWSRYSLGVVGTAGAGHSTFSVSVPTGTTIHVFGVQVEAQPFASKYMPTVVARGIYPETRFASDDLTVTSTGPGLSRADIVLLSRV